MPFYDLTCKNEHKQYNLYLNVGERPPCPTCGENTETLWENASSVAGDDIPGGIWVKHGLCDPETGTPRKYYSKSEMAAEAKRRGLINRVEHVCEPGTDKNRNTVKWISAPPISEEERLKNWYEHEAKNFQERGLSSGSSDTAGR